MEFLKGVHVIDVYAHASLVVDDRLILVDTSSERDAKTVLGYMAKAKLRPKDIATIFITHVHPDHIGGLDAIKRETSARVAASGIEAEYISKRHVYDGPPGPASQRQPPTPVDVLLGDGQTYDGLRVVYTPGHTRGSISLLDESRSLCFVGDAANHEKDLRPMDDAYNVEPRQHRESIKKLATFSFENAVFGHGDPIKGGASRRFQELARTL